MKYKTTEKIYSETDFMLSDNECMPLLSFDAWKDFSDIRHCFTTRGGGVSTGIYASLNFRRDADDSEDNIQENFRRLARFFNTTSDRVVCAKQTHTANVRLVTEADAGKGTVRKRDYTDIDGLVTNEKKLVLFTSHADCVPLYFYDPIKRVIGLSHSGWRGSVQEIGKKTVELMVGAYGSDPSDIYAAIGPSICADCYEVSRDVADEVKKLFDGSEENSVIRPGAAEGRYQLDLWELNRRILLRAGIRKERITVGNLCTCCNPGELFSHRATSGKRGNLGAAIMLC